MTYFTSIETEAVTIGRRDKQGKFKEICTTSHSLNTRGESERISQVFADGIPAETEIVPGKGAWKPGAIIAQIQLHDGRGHSRLGLTGFVDSIDELEWTVDSTTTADFPQDQAAPITINCGEANGTYITLFPGGRLHIRNGADDLQATVGEWMDAIRYVRKKALEPG